MPSNRVELAHTKADLIAARQRREDLNEEWGYAKYAEGWSRRAEDVEVELARVEAEIVALEERQAELEAAPANDVSPSPAPALESPAAAAPGPALPEPECVDTKTAAQILGKPYRTLEGWRLRGEGPPNFKLGSSVLYPLVTLRSWRK